MGKWQECFFRLDFASLTYHSPDGGDWLGKFSLAEIESVSLEAPELNFTCQGRKNRLRASDEGVIRDWYSKLQSFVGRAQGRNGQTPDGFGFQDDTMSPARGNMGTLKAMAKDSPSFSPDQSSGNKSRVDMMYEAHQRKLEKLQETRDREATDEKRRLQESFQKNISKTSKARGKISQSDVAQTAERLFNEHKFIKLRHDQKRVAWQAQETERLADTKRMNLPTRTNSDPGLLTAREAGDRLYSDAERRELWRSQARDAAAKDELTMVRIGVKGTSATSINRCNDLHKEAGGRKEKLAKEVAKKKKEEEETLVKDSVPCGDGKRGANLVRLNLLYEEHKERAKKVAQAHTEAVIREKREIEKHQIKPRVNKVSLSRRQVPPWKDENSDFYRPFWGKAPLKEGQVVKIKAISLKASNDAEPLKNGMVGTVIKIDSSGDAQIKFNGSVQWLTKKDFDKLELAPPKNPNAVKDQEVEARRKKISHADYGLVAIQATIGLRSGSSAFSIHPADYKVLVMWLRRCMKCYRDALQQLQQDSGFASLCSRTSQRLFQEHLLPEVEGWAHRLEPDPIRQVEDDLEALLTSAAKAQETLKEDVAPGASWPCGSMRSSPTGVPTALWAYDPGVKTRLSSETKALVRFGPGEGSARYRHLTDLSRLQIVFASCDMLQAGLEHILKRFEVVDVRNHFSNPGRLGLRFVEVLVVVIIRDGREQVPHVCELRLEPLHFHNATKRCVNHLEQFYTELKRIYRPSHMDMNAIESIARNVLNKPPEGHRLRSFRCHLGRRFGSTICAWRKAFGGGRLLSFQRFREVCYSLHCGEHVTELWQELDPNRGGCISLWELDAEAVSLLVKVRRRMLSVLVSTQRGAEVDPEDIEASMIFARLTSFVRPISVGSLEQPEFRIVCKPLGFNNLEADRAFACLDHFPGSTHAPPATIDVSDIQWLKRMTTLVDVEAVACAENVGGSGTQVLGNTIGSPGLESNTSYVGGGSPLSGGPMNAWANPTEDSGTRPADTGNTKVGAKALGGYAANKAAKKQGASVPEARAPQSPASPAKGGLSAMGVDLGASGGSSRASPNRAPSEEVAGDLGDLGVDIEDDDDYDEEEEEEEEEEEDDDDDEDGEGESAPDQEETW